MREEADTTHVTLPCNTSCLWTKAMTPPCQCQWPMCQLPSHARQASYLKAALLGRIVLGCFVLLLALLRHCSWQFMQQGLCYYVDTPCGRVLGLDIGEVRVHTEGQVARQCPATTRQSVNKERKWSMLLDMANRRCSLDTTSQESDSWGGGDGVG